MNQGISYYDMELYKKYKVGFSRLSESDLIIFALAVNLETQLKAGAVPYEIRAALIDELKDRVRKKLEEELTQLESDT